MLLSGGIPMGKAGPVGAVSTCPALLHPLLILINYHPFALPPLGFMPLRPLGSSKGCS